MLIKTLDIMDKSSVAIIGGGGKTTLMMKLALEYQSVEKKFLLPPLPISSPLKKMIIFVTSVQPVQPY